MTDFSRAAPSAACPHDKNTGSFDVSASAKLLKEAEVINNLGISRSKFYLLRKSDFPQPIRLGRSVRWTLLSVLQWIGSKEGERNE